MTKRNTEEGGRVRRGALSKTVHLLAKGGIGTAHVILIIAGWLLAVATLSALLLLTVGLEEGLSIPGVTFVYVLRTIIGSPLLALIILPVAYVLPAKWREKARALSRRQVIIAIVMCIVIVAVSVAFHAVRALR